MAAVCTAQVEGAALGSRKLRFTPGAVRPAEYRWSIGSAGSVTLVLQTLLYPQLLATGPSLVSIEGGTHNGQSPTFEFLTECLAPLLEFWGYKMELSLERVGFYPAGGGRISARLFPGAANKMKNALILENPKVLDIETRSWSSNIPPRIGQVEVDLVGEALGIPPEKRRAYLVESSGAGNALSVIITTNQGKRVFTSFGERQLVAESVAVDCVAQARRWLKSGASVDEHLQDQLLLPMALARGGRFTSVAPSEHTLTNMDVIRAFLPVDFGIRELGPDAAEISVLPQ
jgi:RNA 3'-terminal phosphate cyclase (ATP)